jgi:hypothetical protein
VWFTYAPFQLAIGADFGLSAQQLTAIGLCTIALTVPARLLPEPARATRSATERPPVPVLEPASA